MNKAFVITFCAFLFLVCGTAMADKYTDKFGTVFSYEVKNGKATITSFEGRTERVRIPAKVVTKKGRSYAVVNVDLYEGAVFYGRSYDTQVIQMEEGISKIGEKCFTKFPKLYEVYLPRSVSNIGRDAFKNGRKISFPVLPAGVLAESLLNGEPVMPDAINVDPIAWTDNTVQTTQDDDVEESAGRTTVMGVAGESDVDMGIPAASVSREKTFCLIIANEKYIRSDTPDVTWANTDGKTFFKYCRTTLGIPQENIRAVYNADYLTMKKQLDWLKMVSQHYGADAKYIFYYAGHGAPDDSGKCYLIPKNGSINDLTTGFPLDEIYASIGDLTAQSALVLVDACFSGSDRHDVAMIQGKRGIARVEEQKVSGKVVAITAASNSQTALSYDEKAHGLFTYYVLKALKERRDEITFGELYDYVKENVSGKAILLNDKEQVPSVSFGSMGNEWRDMKF